MEKIITKTSKQAQTERRGRNSESECPECARPAIGIVLTESTGFLKVKTKKRKEYSCFECGCEWNTGWTES